jgi:hypothetical protein
MPRQPYPPFSSKYKGNIPTGRGAVTRYPRRHAELARTEGVEPSLTGFGDPQADRCSSAIQLPVLSWLSRRPRGVPAPCARRLAGRVGIEPTSFSVNSRARSP